MENQPFSLRDSTPVKGPKSLLFSHLLGGPPEDKNQCEVLGAVPGGSRE